MRVMSSDEALRAGALITINPNMQMGQTNVNKLRCVLARD